MNAQEYLESLLSKTLDIKEIKVSVEKLKENSAIIDWIESNQDIVAKTSPFDVCMFLQKQSIKMVSDKVRNSIIANLYDPYSIMFAICLNQKQFSTSAKNKMSNVFYTIHLNTSKFDMFTKEKLGGNRKKIVNADDVLCECFWMIPLFCKPQIVITMDFNKYISECEAIANNVEDFMSGYSTFVFGNILSTDVPALKQHIHDGAVEYQKILKERNS